MSDEKMSKKLSYLLRHAPASTELPRDENGWIPIENILSLLNCDIVTIERIVKEDKKNRYSFSEDFTSIRANQGHSVPVDLELENVTPPKVLFHGTTRKALSSILETGLTPQARHAVHLSADVDTAQIVGSRRDPNPIVLSIDSSRMSKLGYTFQKSANGVFLTNSVPAEFITVIE